MLKNKLLVSAAVCMMVIGFMPFCSKTKQTPQNKATADAQEAVAQQSAQAAELKTVDIEDVAQVVFAREVGEEMSGDYEIVIRGTDGRNENILFKKHMCRFTDNDFVLAQDKNSIFYVGKPHCDSAEGVWQYDYKNNVDKLLVKAVIGMGCVEISKDRNFLFYVTGGEWFSYNLATGNKKSLHKFKSQSFGERINEDGSMVGGSTLHSIYLEDIKTKKRWEWVIDSVKLLGRVTFSRNLKFACISKKANSEILNLSFVEIIKDAPINPVIIQSKENSPGAIYYLTNDGKYAYQGCWNFLYRINIPKQEFQRLPTVRFFPYRIIEE